MSGTARSSRIWRPMVGDSRMYLDGWIADAGDILESYVRDDPTSADMAEIMGARVWADHDAMVHVDGLRDPIAAEIIRSSVEPNLHQYIDGCASGHTVEWRNKVGRYITMRGDKVYLTYRDSDYCMDRSSWAEHHRNGNVYWDGRDYSTDIEDDVLGMMVVRIMEDCRA